MKKNSKLSNVPAELGDDIKNPPMDLRGGGVPSLPKPTLIASELNKQFNNPTVRATTSWDSLNSLRDELAIYIGTMASGINESVELVKASGFARNINEFTVAVNKTNEDFKMFIKDFEKVKASHEGKNGKARNANQLAEIFMIFENYMQFRAKFDGVMYHTEVMFTEYALDAKEWLRKEAQAAQAGEQGQSAASVPPEEALAEVVTEDEHGGQSSAVIVDEAAIVEKK